MAERIWRLSNLPLQGVSFAHHTWMVHAAVDANCLAGWNTDAFWSLSTRYMATRAGSLRKSREARAAERCDRGLDQVARNEALKAVWSVATEIAKCNRTILPAGYCAVQSPGQSCGNGCGDMEVQRV